MFFFSLTQKNHKRCIHTIVYWIFREEACRWRIAIRQFFWNSGSRHKPWRNFNVNIFCHISLGSKSSNTDETTTKTLIKICTNRILVKSIVQMTQNADHIFVNLPKKNLIVRDIWLTVWFCVSRLLVLFSCRHLNVNSKHQNVNQFVFQAQ